MSLDLRNCDCMDLMNEYPDKYFDLAIVDPPYGIGEDGQSNHSRGTVRAPATKFAPKNWDTQPDAKYFNELFRVSKNQIVWGANHFGYFPPSSCWIVWDKVNGETDFADCELAWASFESAVRLFSFAWNGYNQGYGHRNKELRIHPTQKPVALYRWLLHKYAKEKGRQENPDGDKILDTHLGSCSIAIACHYMGFDLTGSEIDKDYYDAGMKRVKEQTAQLTLI